MSRPAEDVGFVQDDQFTAAYFDERALRYGDDARAMDWSSQVSQQARFRALAEIGIRTGDRVLDVGCGQGDLYAWLKHRDIDVEYVGLDLSAEMIHRARAKVPQGRFIHGAIADFEHQAEKFNWAVASGIFYLRRYKPYEFMRNTLSVMLVLATRGVAYNTLIDWGDTPAANNEFRAKPAILLDLCHSLTPYFAIHADYHPGDMTFHLFKDPRRE